MTKLHVGCGKNIKDDYINMDLEALRIIYDLMQDGLALHELNKKIIQGTITNTGFVDGTVDEVLCEHMMEHLSFDEEKKAFFEVNRILKPGGKFIFEVPDFEWLIQRWLEAQDNFISFYELGDDDHYFGHGYDLNQRWGYLTAAIFGNQSHNGQFHKTGFTQAKIKAIANLLNFSVESIEINFHKNHQNLRATLVKNA